MSILDVLNSFIKNLVNEIPGKQRPVEICVSISQQDSLTGWLRNSDLIQNFVNYCVIE